MYLHLLTELALFQSTHPVRGATICTGVCAMDAPISIHAPREGCDYSGEASLRIMLNFNPRTP